MLLDSTGMVKYSAFLLPALLLAVAQGMKHSFQNIAFRFRLFMKPAQRASPTARVCHCLSFHPATTQPSRDPGSGRAFDPVVPAITYIRMNFITSALELLSNFITSASSIRDDDQFDLAV